MPEPYRIQCAEIWGGVRIVNTDVCTSGLSASICSLACGGKEGGDIYYFSVCGADKLTRIAVADLRGHGEQVSRLSGWLYASLQKRMNTLDGRGVLAELNPLVCHYGFDAMTTAAVVGYYLGDSNCYYSYAGHPPIFLQQVGQKKCHPLTLSLSSGPTNLPLGVLPTA